MKAEDETLTLAPAVREGTRSVFERCLLPGIIFQSVLIGGGYATGREVVEYSGKFGAAGLWAIAVMFLGFSLLSTLAYEVARVFRVYDYKNWIRQLIFSLWPLFDLLYLLMTVLVLGVMSAATGSIAQEVLGWPYWAGALLVLMLVAVLNFYGRTLITRFKTAGTLFLYSGYLVFTAWIIVLGWERIAANLGSQNTSYAADASGATVVWTGLLYVGYNLAGLPATLFVLDAQSRRRDAIVAGLVTGLLSMVPFLLTWLALLAFYPDPDVLGAPVPWIRMLSAGAPAWVMLLYGLVVVWTLIETCTGFIHAIIQRIDAALTELGRRTLTDAQHAGVSVLVLLLAGALSQVGIIDLIARGYALMGYGFLALLALPLLSVGTVRVLRAATCGSGRQRPGGGFPTPGPRS